MADSAQEASISPPPKTRLRYSSERLKEIQENSALPPRTSLPEALHKSGANTGDKFSESEVSSGGVEEHEVELLLKICLDFNKEANELMASSNSTQPQGLKHNTRRNRRPVEIHSTSELLAAGGRNPGFGFQDPRPDGEAAEGAEEEECNDEDDDADASLQHTAFAVEGEPNFSIAEPEDGWEYLRRVKWERQRIPRVVVARHPQKKNEKEWTIPTGTTSHDGASHCQLEHFEQPASRLIPDVKMQAAGGATEAPHEAGVPSSGVWSTQLAPCTSAVEDMCRVRSSEDEVQHVVLAGKQRHESRDVQQDKKKKNNNNKARRVVSHMSAAMPLIPTVAQCPAHLQPSAQWSAYFPTAFKAFREAVQHSDPHSLINAWLERSQRNQVAELPPIANTGKWRKLCFDHQALSQLMLGVNITQQRMDDGESSVEVGERVAQEEGDVGGVTAEGIEVGDTVKTDTRGEQGGEGQRGGGSMGFSGGLRETHREGGKEREQDTVSVHKECSGELQASDTQMVDSEGLLSQGSQTAAKGEEATESPGSGAGSAGEGVGINEVMCGDDHVVEVTVLAECEADMSWNQEPYESSSSLPEDVMQEQETDDELDAEIDAAIAEMESCPAFFDGMLKEPGAEDDAVRKLISNRTIPDWPSSYSVEVASCILPQQGALVCGVVGLLLQVDSVKRGLLLQEQVLWLTEAVAAWDKQVKQQPAGREDAGAVMDSLGNGGAGSNCVEKPDKEGATEEKEAEVEECPSLSLLQGVWLVALCSCIDEPLPADVASTVRAMYRAVAFIRASKDDVDEVDLPLVNVIIAACAYFGQVEK